MGRLCLCVAAALLLAAQHVAAHAVMIEPKSRQWLDYTLRYNYNPHAVHGGGASPLPAPLAQMTSDTCDTILLVQRFNGNGCSLPALTLALPPC